MVTNGSNPSPASTLRRLWKANRMKLFATEVFTPNRFPEYTYIDRPKEELERKLRQALETPNVVVSISGPSKSGKTVLAKKLVGEGNIIHIFGAEVVSGAELWARVLD